MNSPQQPIDTTKSTKVDTQSAIRTYFSTNGGHPKKSLGQNFLIDHNYLPLMIDAAALCKDDLALEIGIGFGVLTQHIIDSQAKIWGVDIDKTLFDFCQNRFKGIENCTLLYGDILAKKSQLNPDIEMPLREAIAKLSSSANFKVIANLPYKVSTTLLVRLIFFNPPPASITVLVQEEFADRLMAEPGTKAYGSVSVYAQLGYTIRRIKRVPGTAFYPPPSVHSSIIHLQRKEGFTSPPPAFEAFTGQLFIHRRKKVKGMDCRPGDLTPEEVLALFEKSCPQS